MCVCVCVCVCVFVLMCVLMCVCVCVCVCDTYTPPTHLLLFKVCVSHEHPPGAYVAYCLTR